MSFIPTQKTLTVGGRTFTESEITAFESGTTGVILYGTLTGSNKYATFRKQDSSSGFQVPAGKTLTIVAIRIWCETASVVFGTQVLYGDNDVGINTATQPTTPVYIGGGSSTNTAFIPAGQTPNNSFAETSLNFSVPQNKYPAVFTNQAAVAAQVFCTIV